MLDRGDSALIFPRVQERANWLISGNCIGCGSTKVTERAELTAQDFWRFRCRDRGRQFNERSAGLLSWVCLPNDIIASAVLCRLRYRLTLRDLSEILLLRPIVVSRETTRDWEA